MTGVSTLIVKCIEKMDGKSRDYKNSGVRSIYRLIALLYAFSTIFEDSKTISNPRIFFTMASLIIAIAVFRGIRIDLSANTIYSISILVKRLSGYISEYNLFRLLRW